MDLRDLAKQLKLSTTTVSRALAGYGDVSQSTRARVVAAADAVGYRPNASARNLKRGRAEAVGLLLPTGGGGYQDPFLAELLAAIGAALAEVDQDLIVTTAAEGPAEIAALRRLCAGGRVDGVILPRTRWDDPRVDLLLAMGFPFVTHGRTRRQDEHPWLDIDGREAFAEASRHVIRRGHRRIALINAPSRFFFARDRRAGYLDALDGAEIVADPSLIVAAEATTPGDGAAAIPGLLAASEPPTAFLCATDRMAFGAMAALTDAGRRPGHDVAVIGYDDIVVAAHTQPPLTTMRQPIAEEGRALVDLLARRVAGAPVDGLRHLWRATLVPRASHLTRQDQDGGNES